MSRVESPSEWRRTTPSRVEVWVEDTRFVLDRIVEGASEVSSLRVALDTSRVGVLGMSLGGATAAEFCKADSRWINTWRAGRSR